MNLTRSKIRFTNYFRRGSFSRNDLYLAMLIMTSCFLLVMRTFQGENDNQSFKKVQFLGNEGNVSTAKSVSKELPDKVFEVTNLEAFKNGTHRKEVLSGRSKASKTEAEGESDFKPSSVDVDDQELQDEDKITESEEMFDTDEEFHPPTNEGNLYKNIGSVLKSFAKVYQHPSAKETNINTVKQIMNKDIIEKENREDEKKREKKRLQYDFMPHKFEDIPVKSRKEDKDKIGFDISSRKLPTNNIEKVNGQEKADKNGMKISENIFHNRLGGDFPGKENSIGVKANDEGITRDTLSKNINSNLFINYMRHTTKIPFLSADKEHKTLGQLKGLEKNPFNAQQGIPEISPLNQDPGKPLKEYDSQDPKIKVLQSSFQNPAQEYNLENDENSQEENTFREIREDGDEIENIQDRQVIFNMETAPSEIEDTE